MFKFGLIMLSSLLIMSESNSSILKPQKENIGAAISSLKASERPPLVSFGNVDKIITETTNSPLNENTRDKESKKKEKINDDELKLKLSNMIDKDDKIEKKEYKDKFISYVLSFDDKKEDYNDNINNGKFDKIKEKYSLYIESDLYINKLNAKHDIPIYNHTKFSDWSMEEKKAILNDDDEDEDGRRRLLQSCVPFGGWGSGSSSYVTFENYAQPVKDQGGCGSCWAFAAVGQYELNYYLYKGIKQGQSEQYVLDCSGAGECSGGWPTDASRFLADGSCPLYFGYDGKDTWSCYSCLTTKTPISKVACITESSTGYSGTSLGFWNIIVNTAQYVGLTFRLSISNNFYYISNNNPYLYDCDEDNYIGRHAMSIYGEYYGDWVLVRNSWGTDWGNDGYFWFHYSARDSCYIKGDVAFNYWI